MAITNADILPPWQRAFAIWGVTNAASTTVYVVSSGIETGMMGIGTGLFIGLILAVFSSPSLLPLGLLLPRLLVLKSVSLRKWTVTVLIVCIFFLLAAPLIWIVYLENSQVDSLRPLWQTFFLLFTYLSPGLVAAFAATSYYCRFWLFNKGGLQGSN